MGRTKHPAAAELKVEQISERDADNGAQQDVFAEEGDLRGQQQRR